MTIQKWQIIYFLGKNNDNPINNFLNSLNVKQQAKF